MVIVEGEGAVWGEFAAYHCNQNGDIFCNRWGHSFAAVQELRTLPELGLLWGGLVIFAERCARFNVFYFCLRKKTHVILRHFVFVWMYGTSYSVFFQGGTVESGLQSGACSDWSHGSRALGAGRCVRYHVRHRRALLSVRRPALYDRVWRLGLLQLTGQHHRRFTHRRRTYIHAPANRSWLYVIVRPQSTVECTSIAIVFHNRQRSD